MSAYRFCPLCGKKLVIKRHASYDPPRPTCPTGHFTFYDNPLPATIAFIDRDGKYLVLRRANQPQRGQWDMVGGFVEGAEHPVEAIVREAKEETGLEIAIDRLIGVYTSVYGDTGKHTLDFAYHCHIAGGKLKLSTENTDAKWLALGEFPKLAFASERKALADLKHQLEK